jgi:hypothetical protein
MVNDSNEEKQKQDMFAGLGFTFEEALEDLSDRRDIGRAGKDPRICICGHPVKRHKWMSFLGLYECNPNAQKCPCKNVEVIGKASDLRMFLRSTRGEGHLHALGQGLVALEKAGGTFEWIADKKCFICKEVKPVIPTAINERGYSMESATKQNILICHDCNSK